MLFSRWDGPTVNYCWGCHRPGNLLHPSSPCLQTLLLTTRSPPQLSQCWASRRRAVGSRVCPPPHEPHCSTGDSALLFLPLDLHPVSKEMNETRQQTPSQPDFEQPLQYSLSHCPFGSVLLFPGMSMTRMALLPHSGWGSIRARALNTPRKVSSQCFLCRWGFAREAQLMSSALSKFS